MIRTMIAAVVLAVSAVTAAGARDVDSLWAQAVNEYTAENYEAALAAFTSIEEAGYVSADLYYNMGNCCYKLGHRLGLSILYYEKALKLDPSYEDAAVNLEIAREGTLDRIEAVPEFILLTWFKAFRDTLSSDSWAWIALALLLTVAVMVLLFRFGRSIALRKTAFAIAVVAVAALGRRGLRGGCGDGAGEQRQELSRLYRPVTLHPARGDEGLRGGQPRGVVPHRTVGRTAGMDAG